MYILSEKEFKEKLNKNVEFVKSLSEGKTKVSVFRGLQINEIIRHLGLKARGLKLSTRAFV